MRWRRWLILAICLPVYAYLIVALALIATRLIAVEDWSGPELIQAVTALRNNFGDADWWGQAGLGGAALVASQAVFLIPMFSRRPPRGERPRSLLVSFVFAGGIASALTVGLLASVSELISKVLKFNLDIGPAPTGIGLIVILLGIWVFWSAVMYIRVRGIWADRMLGRIVGVLLAGTLLELLIVVPIDVMVRRRTDCYCFAGTFLALCLAVVAALWLSGPGIAIALLSRRHRMWRQTHCEMCGYAKGPSPGEKCPECGHAWSDDRG